MVPDSARANKLNTMFKSVLRGDKILKGQSQGNLFIEAVTDQTDPSACVESIISSTKGLPSIQASLRFDGSSNFHNGHATMLLRYIQDPGLNSIFGGDYLQQVILAIVQPPIFWKTFEQSFRHGLLSVEAQQCFGWLLHELISLPADVGLGFRHVAEDVSIQGRLLESESHDVRAVGQRIKHVLLTLLTSNDGDLEDGPGGRHDNDFVDFHDIAIHPTADEIISTEEPFLRRAEFIDDPNTLVTRRASHLDNQFRLLREDMLGELREEVQIVLGKKKGRHRGLIVDGFTVFGVTCGDFKRRQPWGLQLEAMTELSQIFLCKPKDRRKYLTDNRNIFKHQSLACLILDGEIVAFPTIHRDVELLTRKAPIVTLQFANGSSTCKALVGLKLAKTIRLVQIDTAVFAFEPVLRHLQSLKELPLSDELLFWESGNAMIRPSFSPVEFTDQLRSDPDQDLQQMLGTKLPVQLDPSQLLSLLNGLEQRVSLIQGPPGNETASYPSNIFGNYLIFRRDGEIFHWCVDCEVHL